ncbi:MAG: pantoate--beta-alanine ligase [Immundisolibacter sp.]|uniref:pantoate--beta-alanine ligase n=1 Tax=Immundisolibacter sp. TaxID=1934948 RepID=UPI0019AB4715|nr:pantoate--beta-alanine ligase [Immundisolibacter sp.]MBC7160811.1 pantoate--beta-alanine ligase [Immundisolibacter sp.]
MLQTSDAATLRAMLHGWRAAGERVALVPTMGNIHQGHLRLVDAARAQAARVVVSVFVNPTQFDRPDDFDRYPRTLDADAQALAGRGADLLFTPDVETLYPHGLDLAAYVEPTHSAQPLEGEFRPGHFRGMATVVTKLLNLVQPDCAVFGEKDYQQLAVVRAVVRELLLPVEIIGLPTVREADGVAMSSRNQYLTPAERALAPRLYQALQAAAREGAAVDAPLPAIEAYHTAALNDAGFRVEYFRFRNAQLAPPAPADGRRVVLTAAWLGKARLIDNHPFDVARGQGTPG